MVGGFGGLRRGYAILSSAPIWEREKNENNLTATIQETNRILHEAAGEEGSDTTKSQLFVENWNLLHLE